MNYLILALLFATQAYSQTPLIRSNFAINQDHLICVNDGGTVKCPLEIDGITGKFKGTEGLASATDIGFVGTGTQTFGGDKTFTGNIGSTTGFMGSRKTINLLGNGETIVISDVSHVILRGNGAPRTGIILSTSGAINGQKVHIYGDSWNAAIVDSTTATLKDGGVNLGNTAEGGITFEFATQSGKWEEISRTGDPSATSTTSGIVNTLTQGFKGLKQFERVSIGGRNQSNRIASLSNQIFDWPVVSPSSGAQNIATFLVTAKFHSSTIIASHFTWLITIWSNGTDIKVDTLQSNIIGASPALVISRPSSGIIRFATNNNGIGKVVFASQLY